MINSVCHRRCLLALVISVGTVVGCSRPLGEKQYEVTPQPPAIERVKAYLQRYSDGQPVSSELTVFPGLISDLQETGHEDLSIVEGAYQDLQADPGRAKRIALEALEKINSSK